MKNNTLSLGTDLTPTVKYKGRDYRVQSDKNGFRKSKNKYLNGQKIRIIVDEKFGK